MTEEEFQNMTEEDFQGMLLTPLFLQKGVTDDEMEAIYAIGYDYYRAGAYEKAETVFKGLCVLDAMNEKYHMALGGAYQAQRKWQKAIDQYSLVVAAINIGNTTASARAAECYTALGDAEKATSARTHKAFFQKEVAK